MSDGPYQRGYQHGRSVAAHIPNINCEPSLRLELRLIGTTNRRDRAYALGALRGYRQASGFPQPLLVEQT